MKTSFIRKLDFFSRPFYLRYDGVHNIPSEVSLVLSITMLLGGIVYFSFQGRDMFVKQNPKVITNVYYEINPQAITFHNNLSPVFFIVDTYSNLLFDKSYFEITLNAYSITRFNSTITKSKKELNWERCNGTNKERFLQEFNSYGNFTDLLHNNKFDSGICISHENNITLGGNYYLSYFSNFYLEINKCHNSTIKTYCKPIEEINKVINGNNFNLYYLDTNIDTNNYDKPFTYFLSNYFMKLDSLLYNKVDIYFSIDSLTTDHGWLLKDERTKNTFSFVSYREQAISNIDDSPLVLRCYLNLSNSMLNIKRSYMKLQELFALVGGMLKLYSIIAILIMRFFNMYLNDMVLINLLDKPAEVKDLLSVKECKFNRIEKTNMKINCVSDLQQDVNNTRFNDDKDSRSKISLRKNAVRDNNEVERSIQSIKNRITYFDVFVIYFCVCFDKYRLRKKEIKQIIEKIRSIADYSNVIKYLSSIKLLSHPV